MSGSKRYMKDKMKGSAMPGVKKKIEKILKKKNSIF